MPGKRICLSIAPIIALGALVAPAQAQMAADYPTRAVKLISPFSPGGGNDLVSRQVADALSKKFGEPFVVENRPGAGGMVGMASVAKETPDGYIFAMGSPSTMSIGPGMMKQPPFDPVEQFTGVSLIGAGMWLFSVNPDVPASNVEELVALAKEKPGELNYCSAGIGSAHMLAFEAFKELAGIDIVHVPYKGAGPCTTAVVAGEVDITFAPILSGLPFVESDQLKALAVTSDERSPGAPDIPTIKESGYPSYSFVTWYGVVAPAGTPADIVEKVGNAIVEVTKESIGPSLASKGAYVYNYGPDQFSAYLPDDYKRWNAVIDKLGLEKN